MELRFFRCLFTITALLATAQLYAQSKYAIGTFASWPVGSFASTTLDDGSFAQGGWGVMFEDEARFKSWPKVFSLGLHLSYQQNAIDNRAMAQAYTTILNFRTEVSEAKYRPLLMTLGPFFDIPVTPHIDIGIKTGIGFALTNIDSFELILYQTPNENPLTYGVDFKSLPSFTFLLGVNGEFKVSRVIGLTVFADFSAARSNVESFGATVGRSQSHYDLSYLNTGLGVAVILD